MGIFRALQEPKELHFGLGFIDYVTSYYGPGGIFDMGATPLQIAEAIIYRLTDREYKDKPFYGDTMDREFVRDILKALFKLDYVKWLVSLMYYVNM